MIQIRPFNQYAAEYDAWFDEHPFVYKSELSAIKMQMLKVGENVTGVEVGAGAGRYAIPLGIREAVEPSSAMRVMAAKRGLEVMDGLAEHLPYADLRFDFVLFVTICHFDNLKNALREAYRVLKKDGSLILAFIDKESPIGRSYEAKRETSHFYKHATFYTVEKVEKLLKLAGFKAPEYIQTLFGELDEIDELQSPREGYGEGAFVVLKAEK